MKTEERREDMRQEESTMSQVSQVYKSRVFQYYNGGFVVMV